MSRIVNKDKHAIVKQKYPCTVKEKSILYENKTYVILDKIFLVITCMYG